MEKEKFCESCGMPLREKKDFGGGKIDNKHCVYCSDEKGDLLPYETVLGNMTAFIMNTSGLSKDKAYLTAKENMSKMPAWISKSILK